MAYPFADLLFTPRVVALQERDGSRPQYARAQSRSNSVRGAAFGAAEKAYLESADHFFLASISESGWPYVQHRGGPAGFIRVLAPSQLAFADFRGNRQHVSEGNVSGENRVSMIVMDYARQQRLKILGRLRFTPIAEADPQLVQQLALPGYNARVERAAVLDLAALDWNCPQHITPRYTAEEVQAAAAPLHDRIETLEAALAAHGLPSLN